VAVDLHFADVGEGPTVLFVHGWGMAHEVWDRQVTALSSRCRCVAVDLRGHGGSPKPADGYAYADHVDDLRALIARLEIDTCVVVGWSLGGAVAIALAAATDVVSAVALVGAPVRFVADEDAPYGRTQDAAREHLRRVRDDREQLLLDTVDETLHASLGEATRQWLFQLSARMPAWSGIACFEAVIAADLRDTVCALEIPLLLLYGIHDPFIDIEAGRWIAACSGAPLVEFERSAHAPFLEEPDKFNAALSDFVDRAFTPSP
jgi:pimeloyl-ACP methyl ester carboxylesterase